jgi:hypothetical protein
MSIMTRVILDQATLAKLNGLKQPVELCDESGRTLGYFSPAVDRSLYDRVQVPISEEELQRRERELGGRTLAEILADLEKKA